MATIDSTSPSLAPREREGPSPHGSARSSARGQAPGWEGEGSTWSPGLASPASLRSASSPAARERDFGSNLYRLITWLSPGFPVGAFAFSHGLEAAAEGGAVRNRASLQDWIRAVVASGSGRIDADILRDGYRAALAGDIVALVIANQRGIAFRTTAEMSVETTAQGAAFLDTCRAAWPEPFLDRWFGALNGCSVCYAAAVGAATARAGVPLDWALTGYLQAMLSNLVSAGLRLGIVGQTDGQRILAALEPVICAAVAGALTRQPDTFGSATFAVELVSMAHETQYTRLFRS
jgi:urease accessory protein